MRTRVVLLSACDRAELGFVAALARNHITVDSTADIGCLLQKLTSVPVNLVVLCVGDAGSVPAADM